MKAEQPSLRHLQNENKARTKQYYAGGNFRTPGPWTAPEAPKHSQTYVFPSPITGSARASPIFPALGLHSSTPVADFVSSEKGGYWRNGYASGIGQEEAEAGAAAGIDLFGTNEGIISLGGYDSLEESTTDDDPDDFFGFDEEEALQRLSTTGLRSSKRRNQDIWSKMVPVKMARCNKISREPRAKRMQTVVAMSVMRITQMVMKMQGASLQTRIKYRTA
ncbi:hypothetical protein CEUSTIGMA_g12285.t1 [Chlamydomonas eustigma]|uniref:Uncharacterized protein n=1 Tax=Chlamydomonas eustigma TaxID=1157962 RepID=A0A250XP52_9CHLO|nr:hypothetical protein CEUSTIGMA_g12285.t1 [Chlamydomonas eustigma]|eukprot:GAX84864.1 hypothetical protein CEUSTIGMA_g12285.t1 [Chlamydomonas eustigma]